MFSRIKEAARLLCGVAHRTPVLTSRALNEITRGRIFLKCENFQRAGAFKFRGAYNAMNSLSDEDRSRGVITFSSGNHAQAVALAGQLLNVRTVVVMPAGAPAVKQEATRQYGAQLVLYSQGEKSREEIAGQLAAEKGYALIPPFDHPGVIAGQGTSAMELFEEVGDLDYLFVPCGGGGLLSGSAVSAKRLSAKCRVVGVEPELADDATRSFKSGELMTVENPATIADGLRTKSLGRLTFPLIREYVDDMITVSEAEIVQAMFFLWTRLKIVVEPSGAVGLAPLFSGSYCARGCRVGVIISGGNVEVPSTWQLFNQ